MNHPIKNKAILSCTMNFFRNYSVMEISRKLKELEDLVKNDPRAVGKVQEILALMSPQRDIRLVGAAVGKSGDQSVIEAIKENDIGRLSGLLEKVDSFEVTSVDGQTPLHIAVEENSPEAVAALLIANEKILQSEVYLHNVYGAMIERRSRGRINHKDERGFTALRVAIEVKSDPKIVETLINKGADSSVADTDGVTPFLAACTTGNDLGVRMMIQASKGACLTFNNKQDRNGLHLAALAGHEDVCSVLVQVKPSLASEIDASGKTPADLAKPGNLWKFLSEAQGNSENDEGEEDDDEQGSAFG